MPKNQAAVAQTTMATMAAVRPTRAWLPAWPKLTIWEMVSATCALIAVMRKTPRKLHTTAR